ncbi:MAG TPA: hypothetical protein VN625_10660 [Desulfuromonadaceae bacterium]|nr:hypothetical protein [Desulfuromonadaceae bacterium]
MKALRSIHLYVGCLFAPMLVFFAVSGLWQTMGWQWNNKGGSTACLALLSTIHTGRGIKSTVVQNLSSTSMQWFVIAMALSLVLNIILGVAMAFKFGHKRPALYCLLAGFTAPVILVLLALHR